MHNYCNGVGGSMTLPYKIYHHEKKAFGIVSEGLLIFS